MTARPLEYYSSLNCCPQTKSKQNCYLEIVVLYSLIVHSLNNDVRGVSCEFPFFLLETTKKRKPSNCTRRLRDVLDLN